MFGGGTILKTFLKCFLLCSPRLRFFDENKTKKNIQNSNIGKYNYYLKESFSI